MKLLKVHLSMLLGKGLEVMSEAIVSFKRIEEFLLLDELPSSHDGLNVSYSFSENQKTLTANDQAINTFWQRKDQSLKGKANKSEDVRKQRTGDFAQRHRTIPGRLQSELQNRQKRCKTHTKWY